MCVLHRRVSVRLYYKTQAVLEAVKLLAGPASCSALCLEGRGGKGAAWPPVTAVPPTRWSCIHLQPAWRQGTGVKMQDKVLGLCAFKCTHPFGLPSYMALEGRPHIRLFLLIFYLCFYLDSLAGVLCQPCTCPGTVQLVKPALGNLESAGRKTPPC